MKSVWKWIIADVAVLLLAGILLHRSYAEMPTYVFDRDALFLETTRNNAADTQAGYYADGSFQGDSYAILTPAFSLTRGIYAVTVKYEGQGGSAHSQVIQEGEYRGQGAIRGDYANIDLQEDSVGYHIYMLQKECQARVKNPFTLQSAEDSFWGIEQIRIVPSPLSWISGLALTAFLLLCLNGAALIWKIRPSWTAGSKRVTFFLLACVVLLSSAPLLVNYPIQGHDLNFHLMRIEGIRAGLASGAFPVKIYPLWLGGNGYAAGVLYPDLFLYLPALLRMLGMPVYLAYQSYIFLVNLATVCIAFWCFRRMFGEDRIGVLAAFCLGLYPYRLADIYVRAAVGEFTAIAFLPLLLCGVWEIYKNAGQEGKSCRAGRGMLLAGLTGVMQSHILTLEMATAFLLLAGLLLFRKTFSGKVFFQLLRTGAVTLLLNLWFLIPFLDYNEMEFVFNSPGRVEESSGIQQQGLFLYQFFTVIFEKSNSKLLSGGLREERFLGIGLGFLAVLFLGMLALARGRKAKWGKSEWICTFFCAFSLFLTTSLFPYDALLGALKEHGLMITSLQFPWRFLGPAGVFLTWLACILARDAQNDKGKEAARSLMAVIGFCTVLQALFFMNSILYDSSSWRPYDTAALNNFAGAGYEYLPEGTLADWVLRDVETSGEELSVEYSRRYNSLDLDLEVENSGDREAAMDLPLLSYVGYEAKDEEQEPVRMQKGFNNSIRLLIPAQYRGTIHVGFHEPALWRIAELVSFYTLLCLAADRISGCYFERRKRRREINDGQKPLYMEETEKEEDGTNG